MYTKVTISGRICTGKTTLFWALQKKLKWPTFSASQYFRDYSRTHGASLQKAEEQHPDLTREVDLRMKTLLREQARLPELRSGVSGQEHIILEGWMAGIMADQTPGVLRILLTCDDHERVERYAKRDRVSLDEAQEKIKEREASWTIKLSRIYGRSDFFDPENYNLVIDTTHRSLEETLALVYQTLGS